MNVSKVGTVEEFSIHTTQFFKDNTLLAVTITFHTIFNSTGPVTQLSQPGCFIAGPILSKN